MGKFVSVSITKTSEIEKVLINVDQIVSVEKFKYIYRILTTAIKPGAHGSMPVSYDVSTSEFEKKFVSLLE